MDIGNMGALKGMQRATSQGLSGMSVINTLSQNGKDFSLMGMTSVFMGLDENNKSVDENQGLNQNTNRYKK